MKKIQNILVIIRLTACLLVSVYAIAFSPLVKAEGTESKKQNNPLSKFFASSFSANPISQKFGSPIEVSRGNFFDKKNSEEEKEVKTPQKDKSQEVSKEEKVINEKSVEFQTSDVSKKAFLPPDQTPPVAINPEAPSSAISMIESNRRGDRVNAKAYAKQFVRVLQNYMFEVRDIASLIGDALIEDKVISQDDWVGAEQGMDIELAKTRMEMGIPIKPTQDVAMQRIVPDPKKEIEVFYVISRACTYCRLMTSDVERLYRVMKDDTRVKFTTLVIGQETEAWLEEFRSYTGLSMPVFNGEEFARAMNIKFVPVLIVVTPNSKKSYIKSGQQTFDSMYEFVRVAQGLPVEDNSAIQAVIKTPMGAGDKLLLAQSNGGDATQVKHYGKNVALPVSMPKALDRKVQVDKF